MWWTRNDQKYSNKVKCAKAQYSSKRTVLVSTTDCRCVCVVFRPCDVSETRVCCSLGALALSWTMPRKWRTVWGIQIKKYILSLRLLLVLSLAFVISVCLSTHVSFSFRLVEAGLVNVSTVCLSWGSVCIQYMYNIHQAQVHQHCMSVIFHYAVTHVFMRVHVRSALGAFSGPNCETEEQTHDSWGCQGPVGQNLWFCRRHQACYHTRLVMQWVRMHAHTIRYNKVIRDVLVHVMPSIEPLHLHLWKLRLWINGISW